MDPNATLERICTLSADWKGSVLDPADHEEFVELTTALIDWLNAGNFLPTRWQRVEES